MPTIDTIIKTYEKKRKAIIERVIARLLKLMDEGAGKAAYLAAGRRLIGLSGALPEDLLNAIYDIVKSFDIVAEVTIVNGVKESWAISNIKNNLIEKTMSSGGGKKPPTVRRVLGQAAGGKGSRFTVDTNFGGGSEKALQAFIERSDNGLTISRRVWKLSNSYKKTITSTIKEGLTTGKSAREMAKELRGNLRNDNPLQSPGQGVYSSPLKNASRLARNEINLSYANSDFRRWQTQWFVVGIEVKISNRHPTYDICDALQGRYPKDFHFMLWHPNCLCIAIPILATREEQDAMLDYELGKAKEPPLVKYIDAIPDKATSWIKNNASRINGWSNTPYFVQYNSKYIQPFLEK